MPLTMEEKQAVTKQLGLKYKKVTKKEKGQILDSVIDLTGYNRSYPTLPGCSKATGSLKSWERSERSLESERKKVIGNF